GRGHRAEELAVLARLGGEAELRRPDAGGQRLRLGLVGGGLRGPHAGLGGDPLLVPLGRLEGEALGEEEVAGIPRLDAHQVAGLAERGDGVAQDQFDHHGTPSSGARRRRKSSQVSAVPISTQDAKANGNSASAVMESSTAKNIGAGRRAVWMTASPRPAYNASIRTSRLLPTTPAAV